MSRLKKIIIISLISLLILFLYFEWQDDSISTQRFCAYGQVYVEFSHLGRTWGTTFLDENGHPISCTDDNDVGKHTSINARNII